MLQRDADVPTSAYRSPAGGRPSLGRASPSTSSCPGPVVSLPHLLLQGLKLISRKNHEETIGR